MTAAASGRAAPRLVADIGGTHVRFALDRGDGAFSSPAAFNCADFAGAAAAIDHYLAQVGGDPPPRAVAIAVASPVTGDVVHMTNRDWRFSVSELKARFRLERLQVLNDFAALALALPRLEPGDRHAVGGGTAVPEAPMGVLGPGTGLGVAGLIPTAAGNLALATEAGHATMAPVDDRESLVLARIRHRFGHASAERVVSGPGLVNLYRALAEIAGETAADLTPRQVSRRALDGRCRLCRAALDMFFAMLGTVAGNVALTLGARGGLYIAGGIVPRLLAPFSASAFRARFEAKGRFCDYLAAIPSFVVTHEAPTFLGLRAALDAPESR
jgi:glucokinase